LANVINPSGFQPIRTVSGSPYTGGGNMYYIPASDGSAYYIGDLVTTVAGADANGVPQIGKAASAATRLRGAIVGVYVVPPNGPTSLNGAALPLELISIPASKSKDYYVLVADDPELLFEAQDDGTTNLGASAANKNIDFTVATPSGNGQISASVLKNSTVATTSTLPLKLIGLKQVTNNQLTNYARWVVKINVHELGGQTAGA